MTPGGRDKNGNYLRTQQELVEIDAFLRQHYKTPEWPARKIAKKFGYARPSGITSRANYIGLAGRRKKRSQPEPTPAITVVSAPISPSLQRLAAFDPVLARVVREKALGLPPGGLMDGRLGFEVGRHV